jgi:hypothetical protein
MVAPLLRVVAPDGTYGSDKLQCDEVMRTCFDDSGYFGRLTSGAAFRALQTSPARNAFDHAQRASIACPPRVDP